MPDPTHIIPEPLAGLTLSATLRKLDPTLSWSAAKKLITTRRLLVNDTLATNDARRLSPGDRLTILAEPFAAPRDPTIRILHLDPDVIVIDKPPHVVTQRPDQERDLSPEKKTLQPTRPPQPPPLPPPPPAQKPRPPPQKKPPPPPPRQPRPKPPPPPPHPYPFVPRPPPRPRHLRPDAVRPLPPRPRSFHRFVHAS